jgi:hypothetical protein
MTKTIEQLYEELRAVIDGGSESMTHEDAIEEVKALKEENMTDSRIPLPPSGVCPCGSKDLMLAKDQTEYTPVTKGTGWERGATSVEQTGSFDPMGGVRLFCTACGQYFDVPEELL